MKLKRLLLPCLCFLAGILNAQTDFRPGYIIKNDGDTLYGEIDYRGDLLMGKMCRYKHTDKTVYEYTPTDITAFRFKDGKYYITREVNSKKVYLEYLIKGKINIYYLRDDIGDHYYLDKDSVELTEIPYEEGIKYEGDRQVFYQSKKHIGLLLYYMQDAPVLKSKIQSIGIPEHRNLIKIAEDYHHTVCKNEKCIVYERDIPLFRMLLEVVGGTIKYSAVEDLTDKSYLHTGIIGHIWMPRISEKIYFRTGVLFSKLEFENEEMNFYKVPIQLEYIYPRGIFRPRIAYGLNFYMPYNRTVSFNFGGNLKIAEKLFVSITTDIEFNPVFFVPAEFLSYSWQLGLVMKIE